MLERKIAGPIIKALRDDPRFGSCSVEVKVAKGKTLPKSALKGHQRRALELSTTKGGIYHKLSDAGACFGQLPFDGVVLKEAEAYLAIYYETKPKCEIWVLDIGAVPDGSIGIEYARRHGQNLTISK